MADRQSSGVVICGEKWNEGGMKKFVILGTDITSSSGRCAATSRQTEQCIALQSVSKPTLTVSCPQLDSSRTPPEAKPD